MAAYLITTNNRARHGFERRLLLPFTGHARRKCVIGQTCTTNALVKKRTPSWGCPVIQPPCPKTVSSLAASFRTWCTSSLAPENLQQAPTPPMGTLGYRGVEPHHGTAARNANKFATRRLGSGASASRVHLQTIRYSGATGQLPTKYTLGVIPPFPPMIFEQPSGCGYRTGVWIETNSITGTSPRIDSAAPRSGQGTKRNQCVSRHSF